MIKLQNEKIQNAVTTAKNNNGIEFKLVRLLINPLHATLYSQHPFKRGEMFEMLDAAADNRRIVLKVETVQSACGQYVARCTVSD